MSILKFIIALVTQFGYCESTEITQIKTDGDAWLQNQIANPERGKIVEFYIKHGEAWYTKLALALFFPFAKNAFYKMLNPSDDAVLD